MEDVTLMAGRHVYLTTDELEILGVALDVALSGEWNDGDFTFESEEEAVRLRAAAVRAAEKLAAR